MSLIWPATEAEIVTNAPRLHALVIAVADYPHLNGGSGPPALEPLGLSQVSTPRYTGLAITDWLLTRYQNARCPLGSVEVLLSPGEPVPSPNGPAPAASATMANIEAAFTRWKARCSADPDNIAWLYFCGHGVSKGAQYLLPEDYGDPAVFQWKNNIDFDGLRVGMRSCAAQTQLFFVDACRETPLTLLTQLNVTGNPLTGAGFADTVKCSAAYYATISGRQAYGPDDDITYFGQALLSCLNGVAAIKKGPIWVVDTYSLGNALGQTMAQLARHHRQPLSCNPNPSGMGHISEVAGPRVIAAVSCTSEDANNVADIKLTRGATALHSPPGQPKPLIAEVDAGDWTIQVTFQGNQFVSPPPQNHPFMPPVFEGVEVP
jgi:Caspase domain